MSCPRSSASTAAGIRQCRSASIETSATRSSRSWKTGWWRSGILTLPIQSPSLKIQPIFRDKLMLMVSPKNPLAKFKVVPVSEIVKHPLLFPKTGHTRRLLDKLFRPHSAELQVRMELPSIGMIKSFVAADLGVSLISASFARDEVDAGRVKLIDLEDAELYRELGLAYRRDRTLSVASTAFVALLRQFATQMKKGSVGRPAS